MTNLVKHFKENTAGRDFIIGDLHGCYDLLMTGLKHVNFNEEVDRVFSVGDLIDRGPDSHDCLLLLNKPWFFSVKGNHEELMELYIRKGHIDAQATAQWVANGGLWGLNLDREIKGTCEYLVQRYITDLPYIIVVGSGENRFNIVHAELRDPKTIVSDTTIDKWDFSGDAINNMVWGRTIIGTFASPNEHIFQFNISPTYCGHTPIREVVSVEGQIFIDTGAVYGTIAMNKGDYTNHGLTIVDHKAGKYVIIHPQGEWNDDKRSISFRITEHIVPEVVVGREVQT